MIILDTSAIIEILAGSKRGAKLKLKYSSETLAITSISLFELLTGMTKSQYDKFIKFIDDFDILIFDLDSAIKGAKLERDLKKKGKPISKLDFLIAGICISKKLPIVTFDKHFKQISGLDCVLFS